jgi:hyperosmotically inducible protein
MSSRNRFGAYALALLLVVSGGALFTAGCSTSQPIGEQIDDAAIVTAVKAKLAADTDVAALNIDVDANEGVVTLSGRVDTAAESAEAERLARGTDGVKRVINNLSVGDRS